VRKVEVWSKPKAEVV